LRDRFLKLLNKIFSVTIENHQSTTQSLNQDGCWDSHKNEIKSDLPFKFHRKSRQELNVTVPQSRTLTAPLFAGYSKKCHPVCWRP
jgi:hypothetical protein